MKNFTSTPAVWSLRATVALGALLLASCQSVTEIGVPSIYSEQKLELQAGYTPAEKAAIEKNCFAGPPTITKATGRLLLVAREGYVLTHSSFLRGPLWVAEGIPAKQLVGPGERRDNFEADPTVPPTDRAELKDYARAGFDRGHQAPAADFKLTQKLTDESFYLSNMSPQVGAGFNRAIWKELEDFIRDRIKANGSGYVITGPLLYDPAEDNAATADGIVPVKWIGGGLGEYRIDWGPGYRLYLAQDGDELIILFVGGTKKRQRADIKQAGALLDEYKARKAKMKKARS